MVRWEFQALHRVTQSGFELSLQSLDHWMIFDLQILSKVDNNTVMEAVDPEVSVTCINQAHLRKTLQLALLCTKRNPSERPTMHEVAKVLVSLLPATPRKSFVSPPKTVNYARFVIEKGQQNLKIEGLEPHQQNGSCDAQWLIRFGDENTL